MPELTRRAFAKGGTALVTCAIGSTAQSTDPASTQRPAMSIDEFGAIGDGVADDRSAFRRALAAWQRLGGTLRLGAGRVYNLGEFDESGDVFILNDIRDAVLDGNGATIKITTSGNRTRVFLFRFRGYRDVRIANLTVDCAGGDIAVDWQGAYFCTLDGSTPAYGRGFAMIDVVVRDAVAMLWAVGGIAKLAGISVRGCRAERCYYGTVFQENGDDADLQYAAIDCRRAYFPYGVSRHKVRLQIAHSGDGPGADACILIKRYQLDTRNIDVEARFAGRSFPWKYASKLEFQPLIGTGPAGMSGISIKVVLPRDIPPPEALAVLGIAEVSARETEAPGKLTDIRLYVAGPAGWRARLVNDADLGSGVVIDATTGSGISVVTTGTEALRTALRLTKT
jgi:hypothetical protein